MSDIAKIEQRVKNLEYYTSLNTLESVTLNQFVPDVNGLNRFKSGIFVDNFTDLEGQDTKIGIRNSIDRTNKAETCHTSQQLLIFNLVIPPSLVLVQRTPNQDARFPTMFLEPM